MKIGDVVIGNEYIIVRRGLVNTGRVGRAMSIMGNKVVLRMFHSNKDLTLNAMSIEPREVRPAPIAEQPQAAPKFEANDLVKPKQKGAVKKVKAKVFLAPQEKSWYLYTSHKGEFVYGYTSEIEFNNNSVVNKRTGEDITERYLGWFNRHTQITAKRPQNIMEFPFWAEDMGAEYKFFPQSAKMSHGIVYIEAEYNVAISWIDPDSLCKFTEIEIEVDADGNEVLPDIDEQIADAMRKDNKAALGLSFAVYYLNKETGKIEHKRRDGAACHYGMRTFINNNLADKIEMKCAAQFITKAFYINYFRDEEEMHPEVDRYLTWVMNDSPWARYCVTKDIEEAKKGGIRVRTDIPANAMMCTFYALRYPTEYGYKIRNWCEYTKGGLDGTIAFFKAETRGYERDTKAHHQLLDTYLMDLNHLVQFINNEVGGVLYEKYDEIFNYANVSAHHGTTQPVGKTAIQSLQEQFKPKKVEENHPVLGKIVKDIPAVTQIDEFLTKQLKGVK